MRGVPKKVVVSRLLSGNNFLRFVAYLDHRITEPGRRLILDHHLDRIARLSISSRVSDSVGSINIHVDVGQEQVGGWNLASISLTVGKKMSERLTRSPAVALRSL